MDNKPAFCRCHHCVQRTIAFILPTLLTSLSSSLQLIVNNSSIATLNSYLPTNWFITSRQSEIISWCDSIPAMNSAPCRTHHKVCFPVCVKSPSSEGVAAYNCRDSIGIVCSEIRDINRPRPPSVHGSGNGLCLHPTTHLSGCVHWCCLRRLAHKPICCQSWHQRM